MSAPSDHLPKRRGRFRWQFGLRTLLGLMLLACVAFAYLAHCRREYEREFEREQPAIKAIAEIGGKCEMSGDAPRLAQWLASDKTSRVVGVDLSYREMARGLTEHGCIVMFSLREQVTESWMHHLRPLEHLETLDLSGNFLLGDALTVVEQLPRLKTLNLSGCAIDDAGLAHVSQVAGLRSLNLEGTKVGDEGLQHVATFVNLTELEIGPQVSKSVITAAGLRRLQTLVNLEKLRLVGAEVLEAEIEALDSLPNLRELILDRTAASPLAIYRIRRLAALATVSVWHSGQPAEIAAIGRLKKSRPELVVTTRPELSTDEIAASLAETDEHSSSRSNLRDALPPRPPERLP